MAHVAAIAAAEKNDIEFIGVAGASAGALIAALVAVGYTAAELFDPDNPTANILTGHKIDPLSLIGKKAWQRFASATRPAPSGWFKRIIGLPGRAWRLSRLANEIRATGGYFTTDAVRELLDCFLFIKLMEHHTKAGRNVKLATPITFKDIDPEFVEECCSLKVIVTDVTNGKPVIFGTSLEHHGVVVAEAVAASISIPGVFKPARIPSYTNAPNALFADGGTRFESADLGLSRRKTQLRAQRASEGHGAHPGIYTRPNKGGGARSAGSGGKQSSAFRKPRRFHHIRG